MSAEHICTDEINKLKEEVKLLTTKSNNLKHEYIQKLIENAKKDLIIRELKEQIEKQRYQSFEGKLSDNCLQLIKSIDSAQKEDNFFVYSILKDIYGVSLKEKTLSGSKKNSEISSKVKMLLNEIFYERVRNVSLDQRDARKNNMSKLIRNAIDREKRQPN